VKRLTRAQHAAFEAQGYLAPLDAFEPGEASAWRRQLHHALARSDGRADTALRNKPHLLLRWIAELVRDARVVDAVEDLLGPDLLILRSALFVKPPGDVGYVAWHHDTAYWDLSQERVVTAWIALTDSTVANGCVRVVAGSHREPPRPHRLGRDQNNRLARGQAVSVAVAPERVAHLELRAGQMSLHDGRVLHSSPANPSTLLRAGLAVRFIAPDVAQRGPRQGATLVRGTDRYGHFDHEAAPTAELDAGALATHADSQSRYWEAASGIPEMRKIH